MEEQIIAPIKKPLWTRKRAIVFVVCLGFLLRLWAAWQLPVDYDEPIYVDEAYQYAQLIQDGDLNGIIDYPGTSEHPPLIRILYGLTISAFGRGISWSQALFLSRLVSVLFGTLAVVVIAIIDPLAGGLMAVQTILVKYSSQAYLEALPLFFALLAFIILKRSPPGRNRWFILSALALGITAAGKYSYFPIIFVIFYVLIWERREKFVDIILYLFIAGIAFIAFDLYLWHDTIGRFLESLSFHVQYSQGSHVQEIDYPWYQPFVWVSRSHGFQWHPNVIFYLGVDGPIFLTGLAGLYLSRKNNRWLLVWVITCLMVLLVWPTKWPQYTSVVLPAFCLAAATAIRIVYEKIKEQELYWEWLHNMFPRPSRRYMIIGSFLISLLVIGALASQVVIVINRIGWSTISADTSELPNNTINDILALPDGRMLVATDDGVAFWKVAGKDELIDEWIVHNPENSLLPNRRVLSLAKDQDDVYWFGTAAGLASYDGTNWNEYRASDFNLGGEQINAISVDGANHIWIATLDGVSEFDGINWTAYTKETSGLVDNVVFSIEVDDDPAELRIWFGTLTGVSKYDIKTGEWQNFSREEINLGWGGVSDLLIDSTGKLWVCTEGGGISIWDGKSWNTLRVSNSELPYSIVESIAEFEPGVFWIAASFPNSSGGVVAKFDGTSWHTFRQGFTGYSGAETLTISMDSTGRYWFGTRTQGIDLYKPKQ